MKTKKQLATEFDLTSKTVTNILKNIGLDTSKTKYSEQEVSLFTEARRLITEENYSYEQVKEHFGKGIQASSTPQKASKGTANLKDYDQTIFNASRERVKESAKQAMSEIIKHHIPDILEEAIEESSHLLPELHQNIKMAGRSGDRIHNYEPKQVYEVDDDFDDFDDPKVLGGA